MKKLLSLAGAVLLGIGASNCSYNYVLPDQASTRTIEQRIEEKNADKNFYDSITYKNFSKLSFEELQTERQAVPKNFREHVLEKKERRYKFKDFSRFEREVLAEAEKLGYPADKLYTARPKEAIQLALDILAARMDYELVDATRPELFEKGELDAYFYEGKGDCDKYADLLKEVFRIIKENNANCKNVYITNKICANVVPHDWNTVVLVLNDRIEISHIDPTFYDDRKELEASEYYHFTKKLMKMLLAEEMCDFKSALEFLEQEWPDATGESLKDLIEKKGFYCWALCNKTKDQKYYFGALDALESARGMYMQHDRRYIFILETAIRSAKIMSATQLEHELIDEYQKITGKKFVDFLAK